MFKDKIQENDRRENDELAVRCPHFPPERRQIFRRFEMQMQTFGKCKRMARSLKLSNLAVNLLDANVKEWKEVWIQETFKASIKYLAEHRTQCWMEMNLFSKRQTNFTSLIKVSDKIADCNLQNKWIQTASAESKKSTPCITYKKIINPKLYKLFWLGKEKLRRKRRSIFGEEKVVCRKEEE